MAKELRLMRAGASNVRRVKAMRRLPKQPTQQRLLDGLAVDPSDGFGERDVLRANLDAVLRGRAIAHPARPHHRLEPLARVHGAGRYPLEPGRLADGGRADEG